MPLKKIREEIDRIDREIVGLLNARYKEVLKVGKVKSEHELPIFVPEREKALLEKVRSYNDGPMADKVLLAIYREIMSGSFLLEKPLAISFLGPEGTFSHQAALAKFGRSVNFIPAQSIAEVFQNVESGRADYGCVPVENSTEGVVTFTLDTLMNSQVKIIGELSLRIRNYLVGKGPREAIRALYSHPQLFGQCRNYIQNNLCDATLFETSSTAKAAEIVAQCEDGSCGAIVGKVAMELHDLPLLDSDIEDNALNTTRFIVLGKQTTQPTGSDKTGLCFAVKHRAGALCEALEVFKKTGISMTMIESRPFKRGSNWEYCFFVDILGHYDDPAIHEACDDLENICSFFKILGSYPRELESLK